MLKRVCANLSVCACLLLCASSAGATTITIVNPTNVNIVDQPSYTFNNTWIFELVNPANIAFNLIENGNQDFIVSNEAHAGAFTLHRLDNQPFDLLSLVFSGGISVQGQPSLPGLIFSAGGVPLSGLGDLTFQLFAFAGQPGVTGVTSVLFTPLATNAFLQIAQFQVSGPETVPEPATLALVGAGLAAVVRRRRRESRG